MLYLAEINSSQAAAWRIGNRCRYVPSGSSYGGRSRYFPPSAKRSSLPHPVCFLQCLSSALGTTFVIWIVYLDISRKNDVAPCQTTSGALAKSVCSRSSDADTLRRPGWLADFAPRTVMGRRVIPSGLPQFELHQTRPGEYSSGEIQKASSGQN